MIANRLKPGNESGLALIMVIWILLIISAIAIQVCRSAKMDFRSLSFYRSEVEAESLARSALREAMFGIGRMTSESASGGRTLKDADDNTAGFYSYTIVDESGRLNLNGAGEDEIGTLLKLLRVGGAESLAGRIARERERYPGRAFTVVEELLDVDGMAEDVFTGEDANDDLALDSSEDDGGTSWPPDDGDGDLDFGLKHYIRASCPGKVNVNLASREVMLSLLKSPPEFVDSIISAVESSAGTLTLENIRAMSGMTEEIESYVNEKLTDRSECFRIMAEGGVYETGAAKIINAYVYVDATGKHRLTYWWES
ncbi:MAG: hypothetical protein ABIH66_05500 [bacterium]